jgi:hypothetical protein
MSGKAVPTIRASGRPFGAKVDPHARRFAASLPPKGGAFAPRDGPSARRQDGDLQDGDFERCARRS